ncbi:MAG TPA: ABC transporter permease [Candidatus Dormibacteraeota bacterium]|nr:ABC transporter permease [Candidatus Dormibacteraeota bacterium]
MSWMRLRGLMRKEAYEIVRDPSSIAIAFVLPLVLLLIFGYGVSLDARRVSVAEVVDHPTQLTASFLAELQSSPWFRPTIYPDQASAERALVHGRADAILWLRSDFTRLSYSGNTAPIDLTVNGVDANQARIIKNYVNGTWLVWLQQEATRQGTQLSVPVVADMRVWFNPALRSRDYLIPGLIAIIMTLIGGLLTALVVAREWERGTMEGIMVTPVSMAEILLGKLVPYFAMGMGGMILSTAMAVFLFDVPLRGSLLVLFGIATLFLLTALGMGLVISVLARSQFVAAMVAIITTFLPAFILSGFLFDIRSMPQVIQVLTHVVAARYFVAMLQSSFLAGDVWPVILRNGLGMAILCVVFLGIALLRFRKRLD